MSFRWHQSIHELREWVTFKKSHHNYMFHLREHICAAAWTGLRSAFVLEHYEKRG